MTSTEPAYILGRLGTVLQGASVMVWIALVMMFTSMAPTGP